MGTLQGSAPGGGQRALLAAGYPVLLALGAFQGLIGTFQYARPPQPLERNLRRNHLARLGSHRPGHLGFDESRRNDIGKDVARRQFLAQ